MFLRFEYIFVACCFAQLLSIAKFNFSRLLTAVISHIIVTNSAT